MWIPPKLDWTKDDYYNFDDLNRVETNTQAVAEMISYFDDVPPFTIQTERNMKTIEFVESLNRLESNIDLLRVRYTPNGWIQNKTDWKADDVFNYIDANRLETNLNLLYFYYKGNVESVPHCGLYTCGEEVI